MRGINLWLGFKKGLYLEITKDMELSANELLRNSTFKTSRSGGKGGQNINKVSSKVELNFNFAESNLFTEEQKKRIREKLSNRISASGQLQVICEEERSQLQNKQHCLDKLIILIQRALHVEKPRKATKPSRSDIEKRLKQKQLQAKKKIGRRKDFFE